jgi:hypothetical protein
VDLEHGADSHAAEALVKSDACCFTLGTGFQRSVIQHSMVQVHYTQRNGKPSMACFCYDASSKSIAAWDMNHAYKSSTPPVRIAGLSSLKGLRYTEPFLVSYSLTTVHVWRVSDLLAHIEHDMQASNHCDEYSTTATTTTSTTTTSTTNTASQVALDIEEPFALIDAHDQLPISVSDSNASLIVTGHTNGTVNVWRIADRTTLHCDQAVELAKCAVLSGHTREVRSVTVLPDCDLVASSALDLSIRVWNVQRAECLYMLDEFLSPPVMYLTPCSMVICDGKEVMMYDYLRIAPAQKSLQYSTQQQRQQRSLPTTPTSRTTKHQAASTSWVKSTHSKSKRVASRKKYQALESSQSAPLDQELLHTEHNSSDDIALAYADDGDDEQHAIEMRPFGEHMTDDSEEDEDEDEDESGLTLAQVRTSQRVCFVRTNSLFRSGCFWTTRGIIALVIVVVILTMVGLAVYFSSELTVRPSSGFNSVVMRIFDTILMFILMLYFLIIFSVPLSLCILPITALAVCILLIYQSIYQKNRISSRRAIEEVGGSEVVEL